MKCFFWVKKYPTGINILKKITALESPGKL